MNNLIKRVFFIITVLLLVSSCEKEIVPEVKLSLSSLSIMPDGDAETLTITSNVAWSAVAKGGKFIVTPSQGGAGSTNISISASANKGSVEVKDNLVITAGSLTKSIPLAQQTTSFKLSATKMPFSAEESALPITITSNVKWSFKSANLPTWIKSITPSGGEGNSEVTIVTAENTDRNKLEFVLDVTYSGTWSSILVTKDAAPNHAPSKATNLSPNTSITDVSVMPTFSWDASEDLDGDVIEYTAMYSKDGENWIYVSAGEECSVSVAKANKVLEADTKYFYKVKSDDGYSGGATESDVVEFTTNAKDAYADGDFAVYQQSPRAKSVKLVFMGDGYLAEHYKYGGLFDEIMDEGIEALFSVEPYKTYRDYFTVYKVAAYSKESGISSEVDGTTRKTVFSSTLTGGTGVECDNSKVFSYATKVDGIEAADLPNVAICLAINADVYAGTCISYYDGKSIGMCPVSRGNTDMTTYGNLVCHEFGGHGFGRLGDEYVNFEEKMPSEEMTSLLTWQASPIGGHWLNVSPYNTKTQVPWARFFDKDNFDVSAYKEVSFFEGANYYRYGAYRPEDISCMIDNRKYYNAQSRYLIVKRIFDTIGETLDFNDFIAKDVDKDVTKAIRTQPVSKNFVPLAPPILIME